MSEQHQVTDENVRETLTKGTTFVQEFDNYHWHAGFRSTTPTHEVERFTVTGVRKFKTGKTRVAVKSERGHGCTFVFPRQEWREKASETLTVQG